MPKIRSLSNFTDEVEKIIEKWNVRPSTTLPWFRGQPNSAWGLVPGLYRRGVKCNLEREMVRDFKLMSVAYPVHTPISDLETLFLMQHHGMPTRLLDWSECHLIALFFAVRDLRIKKDAAVWVLHPWSLNHKSINWESVPPPESKELARYCLSPSTRESIKRKVSGKWPVAIRASRISPRIVAQHGVFSLHGYIHKGIQDLGLQYLTKIDIDKSSKLRILEQLAIAGISDSVLFPELDGLARELTLKYA